MAGHFDDLKSKLVVATDVKVHQKHQAKVYRHMLKAEESLRQICELHDV